MLLWGKTRSNYQFEWATFLPKKFPHQGLLPMKRHRKIVIANVKHTKGPRIHRHCYMRVPPPPIPRMSHPPFLFNMLGEKKKNFKNPGAN